MRTVKEETIIKTIKQLFIEANTYIPDDVNVRLKECLKNETSQMAKQALEIICENNKVAEKTGLPICQDTGMAVVFAKIGMDVKIDSQNDFNEIINEGVRQAYLDGKLRLSVVQDPLFRTNTADNTPAIIYIELVKGDRIELTALPKGFGSENMSKIKMFNPTASKEEIIDFIVQTVKEADAKPCPPVVVGVGIGGTFEYSALLSKKALCRSLDTDNQNDFYADMEKEVLKRINDLNIGAQGFSGSTTALKVNIEKFPTHIAGLPVAVNICCHVVRHKSAVI